MDRQVMLYVRVHAGSRRSQVVAFTDGVLQMQIMSLPVGGKANRELVALISRTLGIGRGQIDIVRGHTARNKIVAINGLSREEVMERLSPPRTDL